MAEYIPALAGALWLGILTSISPCPLATNIAATAFVGRRVESPRRVFIAGLCYTLGRMLTYLGLGMLLVSSLLAAPALSQTLQSSMNKLLGPLLILSGMLLLELITLPTRGSSPAAGMQRRVETMGLNGGAVLLGVVFALSFCPVSAALFFGSLIPVALKNGSPVMLPALYGVGTALPVIIFSLLLAFSTAGLSRAFNLTTRLERPARTGTGLIFIAVGIFYCIKYIFLA